MEFVFKKLEKNNNKEVVELLKEYREKIFKETEVESFTANNPSIGVFDKDKLIGFCYTIPFAPDVLRIQNLFISKYYRNHNLGSKIIENITVQAKEENYTGLIVSNSMLFKTKEPKKKAKVFYERNGFELILATGNTDVFVKTI